MGLGVSGHTLTDGSIFSELRQNVGTSTWNTFLFLLLFFFLQTISINNIYGGTSVYYFTHSLSRVLVSTENKVLLHFIIIFLVILKSYTD